MMQWRSLVALALATRSHALIRFGCSQLVVDRLDPLVNPGLNPSPHVHQILGGVRIRSFYPSCDNLSQVIIEFILAKHETR